MENSRLEGKLTRILSVDIEASSDGDGYVPKRLSTEFEIVGKDEKTNTIRFRGIVLPDSIGHDVIYSEPTRRKQHLFDIELRRTYSCNLNF